MAIVVISDVGADMITIVKRKEQRMSMTLAEAYGLMYHLQFTLQALAHDDVARGINQLRWDIEDRVLHEIKAGLL